jgi:16S rRNA (uracil1498-N3)-methyltransferase
VTRIYFPGPLAVGSEVALPRPQAHHVARVLRMQAGDALTLFNGEGGEHAAVIARIAKSAVFVRVEASWVVARESPLALTLVQGISRGARMDYTVQKAVELGVARIEPVLAGRGVVRLDAARAAEKTAHWRAVAIGACEQCGRNRVPEIAPVRAFDEWLARWRGERGAATGLLLAPDASRRLAELPKPAGGVTLLAGPEGGFTAEERRAGEEADLLAVRLGPRVLRTETAALAALAALQALWGDF